MPSPGSLAKILPPSGLKAVHVTLALASSLLAGFWLYSWMRGEPDAYPGQHMRGFTLSAGLLLIGLAQLTEGRALRSAFLLLAGACLLVAFLLF